MVSGQEAAGAAGGALDEEHLALGEAGGARGGADGIGSLSQRQGLVAREQVDGREAALELRRELFRSGSQGRYYRRNTPSQTGSGMPTLFERIVARELPADIVYQDDQITAFRDIHPRAPVHILIVPNKPIPTVNDIADEDAPVLGRLFLVARDLAKRFGIAEDGYRLIVNCNKHGGQEGYHLHLHLVGGAPLGVMVGLR